MPARQQSVWYPDVISVFGCPPMWLHHTRMEVQSPCAWRLQSRMAGSLCDLEMTPCPHAVLCKSLVESCYSPVSAGLGGGAAHVTACDHRRLVGSQSGCPIKAKGSGIRVLGTPWRSQTQSRWICTACFRQAHPLMGPVRRRAHPLCSLRSGER